MSKPRLVVAPGVFDLLHYGHVHFLTQARQHGDKLVVLVHDDRDVERQKGCPPIVPLKERLLLLQALRIVGDVVSYRSPDLSPVLSRIQPDCLCVSELYGYDPDHEKTLNHCRTHGIDVVRIAYTTEVSSTMLKDRVKKFWNNRRGSTMLGSFKGDTTQELQQTDIELALIRRATLPGETLVDLGCGDGRLTNPLGNHFSEVIAVDFSNPLLDKARKDSPHTVRYFSADVLEFEPPFVVQNCLLSGLIPCLDDEQLRHVIDRMHRFVSNRILVRTSVGLKDRVEVVNQVSEVSADTYTAYYRTPGEIIAAFEAAPVMDLYNVVSRWKVVTARELYRHQEDTAVWWFVFEPGGGA